MTRLPINGSRVLRVPFVATGEAGVSAFTCICMTGGILCKVLEDMRGKGVAASENLAQAEQSRDLRILLGKLDCFNNIHAELHGCTFQ